MLVISRRQARVLAALAEDHDTDVLVLHDEPQAGPLAITASGHRTSGPALPTFEATVSVDGFARIYATEDLYGSFAPEPTVSS